MFLTNDNTRIMPKSFLSSNVLNFFLHLWCAYFFFKGLIKIKAFICLICHVLTKNWVYPTLLVINFIIPKLPKYIEKNCKTPISQNLQAFWWPKRAKLGLFVRFNLLEPENVFLCPIIQIQWQTSSNIASQQFQKIKKITLLTKLKA